MIKERGKRKGPVQTACLEAREVATMGLLGDRKGLGGLSGAKSWGSCERKKGRAATWSVTGASRGRRRQEQSVCHEASPSSVEVRLQSQRQRWSSVDR